MFLVSLEAFSKLELQICYSSHADSVNKIFAYVKIEQVGSAVRQEHGTTILIV